LIKSKFEETAASFR
jgi:platelet-activating factor acetylhydrolase IB subunit alpha